MKRILAAAALAWSIGAATSAQAGSTLDNIRSKGLLACGVNGARAGFSAADSAGKYSGLDVDICRAVTAAIFGTPDKVKFVPLTTTQMFVAVQTGEVDMLSRNVTWTISREANLGMLFGPTTYYDGQGFIVRKSLNVKSAKQLSGATVCVQPGTTTELNLADYFRTNKMELKTVVIDNLDEVENAFFAGRCDVFTTDASGLAGTRATKAQKPEDYIILPEVISKEPLSPIVRKGDDQFFDILRWSVFALIQAEEKGVTSKNVDDMLKSQDPDVKRFLGVTPGNGKALGLDEAWAYNIVKAVGNYGEVFDRNLGKSSPLKLDRGLNDLWTTGGLMYAPPAR